jgi:hypothetical protein
MKDLQTSVPLQGKYSDQERRKKALAKVVSIALAAQERATNGAKEEAPGLGAGASRNGVGRVKGERTNGRNDPRSV